MRDLVPLTTRLGVLSAVRVLLTAAAATTLWAAPTGVADVLLLIVAGYGLFAAVLEAVRRFVGTPPLPLVGGGLLVDGVFLVAVVTLTGGPAGLLFVLIPVHLIAVTLLASYRTGLKLAMWHSLLLAVAYFAQQSELLAGAAASRQATVTAVMTFWFVAIVTAICSAFNERELRRGRAGFEALAAMAQRLQRTDDADEVAPVLVEAVQRYTGYRRAAVLLYPEDGLRTGHWVSEGPRTTVTLDGDAPAGETRRCWDSGHPALVKRLDPEGDRPLLEMLPDARNVVVVPLLTDHGPLGVLAVEHGGRRRARIPASVVTLLGQFAAHAALAYRKARLLEQVRRLAVVDGLTALPNRRAFDNALAREVERALRTGQPLTLALLDIDHFKHINDTHGHQAGDEVLRQIGRTLSTTLRASDVPARYGGEEFAVIMPACGTDDAVASAERLRAAISAAGPMPVTVSVGLASLPADAAHGPALVRAADAALYRAKAAGRDRVMHATGAYDTA